MLKQDVSDSGNLEEDELVEEEEGQCKEVHNKFHETLKQESENLGLNRYEENLWAAFPSSTKVSVQG